MQPTTTHNRIPNRTMLSDGSAYIWVNDSYPVTTGGAYCYECTQYGIDSDLLLKFSVEGSSECISFTNDDLSNSGALCAFREVEYLSCPSHILKALYAVHRDSSCLTYR